MVIIWFIPISGWWFQPTPLKNDGVRQLGWWNSQQKMENGKSFKIPWFQSPPTRYIYIYIHIIYIYIDIWLVLSTPLKNKIWKSVGMILYIYYIYIYSCIYIDFWCSPITQHAPKSATSWRSWSSIRAMSSSNCRLSRQFSWRWPRQHRPWRDGGPCGRDSSYDSYNIYIYIHLPKDIICFIIYRRIYNI